MHDDAFKALGRKPRRDLLVALDEATSRTLDLDEQLVDDATPIELHHRHLPVLDDAGFVDWNRDANTVAAGRRFDECKPLIDAVKAERTGDAPPTETGGLHEGDGVLDVDQPDGD